MLSTIPAVRDGAIFAFVTSAGTDPEAILVIEERQPSGGGAPVWYRALARFTDLGLAVHYQGKEVLSDPMIRVDMLQMYPKQQYRDPSPTVSSLRAPLLPGQAREPLNPDSRDGTGALPALTR